MAVIMEANYSKKIGLPAFSSHQFSVTIKTELTDVKQADTETTRLYNLLQGAVDREIQTIGFLPDPLASEPAKTAPRPASRQSGSGDLWACSPKQKELILKIVADARLDFREIEHLAQERFSLAVKALNKMQASNLIDELLGKYGGKPQGKPAYGKGGRP